MPTVVFVSPKGGAGKTTSAFILATQLAKFSEVEVVDADPNRPIANWVRDGGLLNNLRVTDDVTEDNIGDVIDDAAMRAPFVIVDLEGTASKIVVMALTRADFVVVPTQGSHLDAKEAAKALDLITQQEKMMRRRVPDFTLPFKVLLTRTNPAIRSKNLTHIQKNLIESGIPVFDAEMHEREAFRSVFSFNKTLEELDRDQVNNVDKAIANAEEVANELIAELRKLNK